MVKRAYKIDAVDMKILNALQEDGRISNIDLSTIAGISPSPCLRRLRSLQESGIIKSFSANLDETFFGYNLIMFASVSIDVQTEKQREEFENAICEIGEIKEIYCLSLDSDYLLKFLITDWLEYKRVINTKLSKVPYVKKIRTTQITRVLKKDSKINI
jgi:Lrp/AsnC family leucine-responsive transcriptional regulator